MLAPDLRAEDREIARTVNLLGGKSILRRPVENRLEVHDLIRDGLPGHALQHLVARASHLLADHGTFERAMGISWRTYQRRKDAPDKKLSPEQSGRTWKFAEILGRAIDLFGSQSEAEAWLERPAIGLDQRRPIDLLSTPAGLETLEDHLTRLEYGVYM
jgi:putative toxin-antitoxin system antitoxin component (TIGR02293 family)